MNILYIVFGIIAVIILWSIWGFVSSRVENTEYTVVSSESAVQGGVYEIRLYPAHIVAQTTVTGTYSEALSQGFRIVAGYIFGGNAKKQSIAMTAPVVEQSSGGSGSSTNTTVSESIAMTAPVMATMEGETHTIAFGMPRSYTLDTLPTPTDPRVQIVTIPEKKMAVIRFSWFRTDARVQAKKQELLSALAKDNVTVVGSPQYAGYNAPWTPPWMNRNEVLVEIK